MIREVNIKEANPFAKSIEYIEDNKSIGILKYSLIYDRMEIDNIEVIPEYRCKGIGTKLMSYLISLAIENRVVNITLEVRISNEVENFIMAMKMEYLWKNR